MDSLNSFLDIAGTLLLLVSMAIVFTSLVRWITGKDQDRLFFGLKMIVFFGLLDFFGASVLEFVNLESNYQEVGRAITTLLWLSVALCVNAGLDKFVWNGVLARNGQVAVPQLLTGFVSVFVYLIAVMISMHFVYGEPITAIAATSGAAAFVLGYSAQSTLGELFSGISINLSKSIGRGDEIKIGDLYGRVEGLNWRSITLYEYLSGSQIIIPNSAISSKEFRNYSRPQNMRRHHKIITAEFSAPPDLVERAITEELKNAQFMLQNPGPVVAVQGMSEYGMDYRILWWYAGEDDFSGAIRDAMAATWTAFRRHGIKPGLNHQFAGPGSQFDEQAWPERQSEISPATIERFQSFPIFSSVDEGGIREVVDQAKRADYAKLETIYQPGGDASSIYIVYSGRAGLRAQVEGCPDFTAIEAGPGECFGVQSVYDQGQRKLQAIGVEYSVIYEVSRQTLIELGEKYPDVRQYIDDLSKSRKADIERRTKAYIIELATRDRKNKIGEIVSKFGGNLNRMVRQSWFGRLRGAPGRQQLLDAAMASVALVAMADGELEDSEREQVLETFEVLGLTRKSDRENGMKQFDHFCSAITKDTKQGETEAFKAVRAIKSDPELAELVLDICISVSAADGEVFEEEEQRIADVRKVLGLEKRDG